MASVTSLQKWNFTNTPYFISKTPGTILFTIEAVITEVAKQ